MFCVCVCCLRQSQHMWWSPALNLYFKSFLQSFICDSADRVTGRSAESGLWGMTGEGGVDIRAKALMLLRFLWSCCSEGPTSPPLLSAHQGQVPAYPRWKTASNGPGSLLSQTETPPRLSRRSFLRQAPRTSTRRSLTRQSESQYPAEAAAVGAARDAGVGWGGDGEKVTGKKRGSWEDARDPMMPSSQVNVAVHSFQLCASSDVSQLQPNIYFFSFPPITVKVTASVVTLASVHKSHPSSFPLPPFCFRPVATIRHEKASTAHPKDTEELFVLGLVLLHAIFNLGQKGKRSCSSYLRWHGGFAPLLPPHPLWRSVIFFFWNLNPLSCLPLVVVVVAKWYTGWNLFRLFGLKAAAW